VIWQWFGNDANEDYGLAVMNGSTGVPSTNPAPPIPRQNWWDKNSAFYVLLKLYLGSDYEASLQFHDPEYAGREHQAGVWAAVPVECIRHEPAAQPGRLGTQPGRLPRRA
jgi:hypothetical protein